MPDLSVFITPQSLWSLWVPGFLLALIVAAAVYFARSSL